MKLENVSKNACIVTDFGILLLVLLCYEISVLNGKSEQLAY